VTCDCGNQIEGDRDRCLACEVGPEGIRKAREQLSELQEALQGVKKWQGIAEYYLADLAKALGADK
jgi:hypothetical protein